MTFMKKNSFESHTKHKEKSYIRLKTVIFDLKIPHS